MPPKGRLATKPRRELSGQRFGKWLVLGNPQRFARGPVNCDWLWDCRCECGPAGREPNCRWATSREQINNRRVSIVLEFQGEKLPLTVWAERLGAHVNTLRVRLKMGWGADKVLGTPIRTRRKQA